MNRVALNCWCVVFGWAVGCGAMQSTVLGADGDPLAIVQLPDHRLAIETMSGFQVLIQAGTAGPPADLKPDAILDPSEMYDHLLHRSPNQSAASWQPIHRAGEPSEDALIAKSTSLRPQDQSSVLSIKVDGVSILVLPPDSRFDDDTVLVDTEQHAATDLLVLFAKDTAWLLDRRVRSLVTSIDPGAVLLSGLDGDDDSFHNIASSFGDRFESRLIEHNTLAISRNTDPIDAEIAAAKKTQLIRLGDTPWRMPDGLAALFQKMEAASEYSQRTFDELSADQMNFKPSNGSHTPRWNAEHMAGRQRLFFSQIYHAFDPAIPVMDANPKQMPDQYVAAHPQWDGAEEARAIDQVGKFCRRFAYLLDGMELDEKPPAVRWRSLRALLVQMDRHYHQHTANVVKKFEFPDWPAENVRGDRIVLP